MGTTIFAFILFANPGIQLPENWIKMDESQKKQVANVVRKNAGVQTADVKVFAHSEWDAPTIRSIEQTEVAQNFAAIQQGVKKILQSHGIPKTKLGTLVETIKGNPNPDVGFITFWIIT